MAAPITRLLVFTPHPSVGGGVVSFVSTLTSHLTDAVHAETFIVGRRPGTLARAFRVLVPLIDAMRLTGILMTRRHDVYHVNPSLDPRSVIRDALFLIILRTFRRKNTIVFFHGWIDEYYRRIAGSSWYRSLFRLAFGFASRTFVLTAEFARKLDALGIDRQRIGVTTTMFDGKLFHAVGRNRQDREVRILFMSRFIVSKGVYELLEAFARLYETDRHVRLTLAGDGPESAALHRRCEERGLDNVVLFPGYVEGADKAQLLLDADIYVLPSYSEGCPISLLEAMGAGLPVVASATGAIPDLVTNGQNGFLLPTIGVLEIAEAIGRLAADRDLRIEIGKSNRDKAWSRFEAGCVTESLENEYRRFASDHLN